MKDKNIIQCDGCGNSFPEAHLKQKHNNRRAILWLCPGCIDGAEWTDTQEAEAQAQEAARRPDIEIFVGTKEEIRKSIRELLNDPSVMLECLQPTLSVIPSVNQFTGEVKLNHALAVVVEFTRSDIHPPNREAARA